LEAPFSKFGRVLFTSLAAFVLVCLASCGSSASKVDEFIPSRIVVIGDSYSYLGTPRQTVNDGSTNNIWVEQVAAGYGLSILAADGKLISGIVDSGAGSEFTIAEIKTQIGALSSGNQPKAGDLLLVMGGQKDIMVEAAKVGLAGYTLNQAKAAVKVQAHSLRDYVEGLINPSGLYHIMLLNVPSLNGSPYATSTAGLNSTIESLTREFNDSLKENFGSQPSGAGIRLYDTEMLFKGETSLGRSGITNFSDAFCGLTVPALCTGTGSGDHLYATDKYPTPTVHRILGSAVYGTMRGYSGW